MMPGMGKDFGLTEDQKQEMAALMGIYGPRLKELRERGDAKRKELMALAPDDPAYDDLTEDLQSSADRIAGRALPHPELLTDVATNLAEMLRPRWERTIRPPGTAIG